MLTLMLPHYCIACERRTWRPLDLCEACETALPWIVAPCIQCGLPDGTTDICASCHVRPPDFCSTIAALRYEGEPQRWVQKLKYGQGFRAGAVLGTLLAANVKRRMTVRPDVIVPIPLAAVRLLRRGHNQAYALAKRCKRSLGIPLRPTLLTRRKNTQPQTGLGRRGRARNVAGAFHAESAVAGLHVALVDDVMTTGATLNAAARACRKSGAARVDVWVATRRS